MNIHDVATLLMKRCERGSFFATLTTNTQPEMRKTDNPYFGRIRKLSRINVTLNFNYKKAVDRQREREAVAEESESLDTNEILLGVMLDEFNPEPRKWGERIPKTCLVTHKGKLYLETKAERAHSVVYTCDGVPIDKEVIEPWLRAKNSNAEHQGVEKEIIVRDFALENVESITFDGTTYIITGNADENRAAI